MLSHQLTNYFQVAKDNEVMVAISNANYAQPGGMLDLWMAGVRRANVTNALVVALDDATQQHAESLGFTAYQMSLQVRHCSPLCLTAQRIQIVGRAWSL